PAAPCPPETTNKLSQIQKNVLASPRLKLDAVDTADIIWREQNDGESDFAMRFDFFNDGAALSGLFVQDDGIELELLQKSGNGLTSALIMTMDDEDLAGSGPGPDW